MKRFSDYFQGHLFLLCVQKGVSQKEQEGLEVFNFALVFRQGRQIFCKTFDKRENDARVYYGFSSL
jgi:hypothetical protein